MNFTLLLGKSHKLFTMINYNIFILLGHSVVGTNGHWEFCYTLTCYNWDLFCRAKLEYPSLEFLCIIPVIIQVLPKNFMFFVNFYNYSYLNNPPEKLKIMDSAKRSKLYKFKLYFFYRYFWIKN